MLLSGCSAWCRGQIEKYSEDKESKDRMGSEQSFKKRGRNEGRKERIKVWEIYTLCACV